MLILAFDETNFINLSRKTVLFEEYEFNTKSDEYKRFSAHKDKILFVYIIFVDLRLQEQLPKIDEQALFNYISRQHHNSFVSLLPINNPQQPNPSMVVKFPYQDHLYLKNKIEYYCLNDQRQIFCENTEDSLRCKKLNFSDLSVLRDNLQNTINRKVKIKRLLNNWNLI